MTRKPGFLIIGAMKAGTTTLYEDLRGVEGVYLPPEKEPEDLIRPEISTPEGQARYFAKFKGAPDGTICGEASTAYTKRPTYEGVADVAHELLGPDLKLIYMTRHPVKRSLSQYHHQLGLGYETGALNDVIVADPSYADYSRYDWQLAPWRACFGVENLLVVSFEDYLADRMSVLSRICDHLGVAAPTQAVDETHRNKSAGKAFVPRGGLMEKLLHSRLYQFTLKPLMSTAVRDWLKAIVLPKTQRMTETLSSENTKALEALFEKDAIAGAYLKRLDDE